MTRSEAVLLIAGEAKFLAPGTRYDNRAYEARLHRLVEDLELDGAVRFIGQRSPTEMPELMSVLDLLLLPSWEEPFGKVMIEAMATGTPVVATEAGGPAEVIRDGTDGRLLPPRHPEVWAEAIETLLERPEELERMSHAARARARCFDRGAHRDAVLAAYREALGLRSGVAAETPLEVVR
jgi:D-inositol-3-phosphate glycosyltransferase